MKQTAELQLKKEKKTSSSIEENPFFAFFYVLILVMNNWHLFLKILCFVVVLFYGNPLASVRLYLQLGIWEEKLNGRSHITWEHLNGINPIKSEECNHGKKENGRIFG